MHQASNIVPFAPPAGKTAPWAFEALDCVFQQTDADFCSANLSYVRVASFLCSRDWREVEDNVHGMLADDGEEDLVSEVLDNLKETRGVFEALASILECAEARILLTLDRITPKNNPAA